MGWSGAGTVSVDNSTVEINGSGQIQVKNNGIGFPQWQRTGTAGTVFKSAGTGADAEYGNAGWVLVSEQSVSAVSTVSFASLTGYSYYRLEFVGYDANTSVSGLTFNNVTTNNYDISEMRNAGGSVSVTNLNAAACARNVIVSNWSAGQRIHGFIDIWLGAISGGTKVIRFISSVGVLIDGTIRQSITHGHLRTAQTDISRIDVVNDTASGYGAPSITGVFRLYAKV